MKDVRIRYRAGKENANADALSHSPYLPPPATSTVDGEVQVAVITASALQGGQDADAPQPSERESLRGHDADAPQPSERDSQRDRGYRL